jgi:hypothetical protein
MRAQGCARIFPRLFLPSAWCGAIFAVAIRLRLLVPTFAPLAQAI